ncbi:restriction endonuclease subunit S [Methanofollis fontis]|nr:restriction endonuclease subunit S [Methanofollis fontis]
MRPEALLLDHFAALAAAPGGVAKLRQLILQLAVQGRLVPQDPADEPASVLLERIAAEKRRLVREGVIKKAKPLPAVDEVPFAVPAGWVWTRLEEIGTINPRNKGIPDDMDTSFVPMTLISEKYGSKICSEPRKWREIKNGGYTHFANNDVVCAKITPCFQNGKSAVIDDLIGGIGAGTTELHVFRSHCDLLNPFYVLIYLKSPGFINNGVSKMTGSAGQKRVPREYFSRNPFPLPPLPEQHRIVAKVDTLMALCDALEARQAEQRETHTNLGTAALAALSEAEAFEDAWALVAGNFDLIFDSRENVAALRQTVFSLAIKGFLTSDWRFTHSDIEQIEVPFHNVSKQSKKNSNEDARGFFSIPDLWEWLSTHAVGEVKLGRQRSPKNHTGPYMRPYLRVANVYEDRIDTNDVLEMNFSPKEYEIFRLQFGDILLNEGQSRELVGRPAIYRNEVPGACFQNTLVRFRPFKIVIPEYALIVFRCYLHAGKFLKIAKQTTNIAHLGANRFSKMPFPLPPLPEQHRIVAKVDALMALCDALDARIAEREETGTRLIEAVVGSCAS